MPPLRLLALHLLPAHAASEGVSSSLTVGFICARHSMRRNVSVRTNQACTDHDAQKMGRRFLPVSTRVHQDWRFRTNTHLWHQIFRHRRRRRRRRVVPT
jgi:hypothetical protein